MFSRSGTDASRIDSLGKLDGVGPMCALTGPTWLFDLARYGFDHGTEDERKNLWDWRRLNKAQKMAVHLESETQTLPAIPLRGVCVECKAKFVSLSQNNCGPQGQPLYHPPNYFSNLHQSSPMPDVSLVHAR